MILSIPPAVLPALSLSLALLPFQGGDPKTQKTTSVETALRKAFDELHARSDFPGATLAVILPNGREITIAVGKSSLEPAEDMRPTHLMPWGSVGKTFVAAMALDSIAQGKLQLEDRVATHLGDAGESDWFARLPNHDAITIADLLRHTSGLPRYVFARAFWNELRADPSKTWSPRELLRYVFDSKPLFEAGTNFAYSDTNYILLGIVLEQVTKTRVYDWVLENLVRPNDLQHTEPMTSRKLKDVAQGHVGVTKPLVGSPLAIGDDGLFVINPQFEWCGGGWYGSALDLARWGRLLWSGQVLRHPYLQSVTNGVDAARAFGQGSQYGVGAILRRDGKLRSIGHDGVFPGYSAAVDWFPDVGIAAALLVNEDGARETGIDGHEALVALVKTAVAAFEADDDADVAIERLRDALSIHQRTLTIDTHKDISPLLAKEPPQDQEQHWKFRRSFDPTIRGTCQVDFPKMRQGGLDCAFFIVYVGQGPLTDNGFHRAKSTALDKFEAIHRMALRFPDQVELALRAEDVERIAARGKLVACIGIENGYPMGNDLGLIEEFYRRGARYMGITHNKHNQLGDSHTPEEPLNGGLTELGRSAVSEMNRLGIMVDVSHTSKQTMLDAVRHSKAPVLASHSAVHAIYAHGRNLDDEQLRALAASGGVVQVVAFASYLDDPKRPGKPRASVVDLCDHIDHAVRLIGIDHVAISSDFDGGGGILGWNSAAETFEVTHELVRRGYSESDIAKLWSQNTLRVWKAVEEIARRH
ncbi:MAG: membrane dipeptidase [Planctomycetes bacterium]|nr:membrane dipeptidase [Planctomycetota bacterium]MCB9920252.1 membrane dipeptidase [Planctomycetota bacterium]